MGISTEPSEILKKFKFEEEYEEETFGKEGAPQYVYTGFPEPIKRYRLWWENFNLSIEESYFWVLQRTRRDSAFPHIIKTEDVFAASENSSFFGVNQQRLGLQQDKVSTFLATIGKMVKELFQLVRELRIIDERLTYYIDSYNAGNDRKREASEITLKGIWIDMVEGGGKNPASVYGMARELQFATLPDLFFATHPQKSTQVDEFINNLKFNRKVKEVLKRKLKTYLVWKEHTHKELETRRTFTIKFLRQHYDIIKMYMNWVRPYLKHINRLTLDERKLETPDLIAAFEGSMIEIEYMAYKLPIQPRKLTQNKTYHAVMISHFLYRTRPAMNYQQEGYQRGPIHVGRMQWELRGYLWTKKQMDDYLKIKEQQDLELMKTISGSVKAAMEALGDELEKYLKEAGEPTPFEKGDNKLGKEDEIKRPSMLEPFKSVFKGFGELGSSFFGSKGGSKKESMDHPSIKAEKKLAEKVLRAEMYEIYKNFKKEHKMMSW